MALYVNAISYAPGVAGTRFSFKSKERFEVQVFGDPDHPQVNNHRTKVRHLGTGIVYYADWFIFEKRLFPYETESSVDSSLTGAGFFAGSGTFVPVEIKSKKF